MNFKAVAIPHIFKMLYNRVVFLLSSLSTQPYFVQTFVCDVVLGNGAGSLRQLTGNTNSFLF